jgi:hypothetical protein
MGDLIMGTRSLTFTHSTTGENILCLYRQFDGYPEGHGKDLAEILNTTESNGMECLSASIVAKLKTSAYNIYIYPSDTKDAWQEYEYHVNPNHVEVFATYPERRSIFVGNYHEFQRFCSNQNRKAA